MFRFAFLGQGTVSAEGIWCSLIETLLVLVIGTVLFNRVEKTFMDTV